MTTFALVHGAWQDGTVWDLLRPELKRRGHAVGAPSLPVQDRSATYDDYLAAVLASLPDGESTTLVGHSFGSETAALVAATRPVDLLVYLCPRVSGFHRPPGEPSAFRRLPAMPALDDGGRLAWDADVAQRTLYASLPPATAKEAAAALQPQATEVWQEPFPLKAPPAVPSAFVLATDDQVFNPAWSRWAAEHVIGLEPIELRGGHFPMLERPAELAALLSGLVRDGQCPPPARSKASRLLSAAS
jgi:pimeloyl-ACP methyl ester carboxylesterase